MIRLKDVATTLYQSGKTSFQDIIKINIKIEILKEDLITLSSKKKNIEAKLCELLNLPANTMDPIVSTHGKDRTGSQNTESKEKKAIYWRAPMDPMEIYDEPGKSKMGMDLVPVYNEEEAGNVGAIAVLIGNSGMSDNAPIYAVIADAMEKSPIPVLPMFTSLTTAGDKIDYFRKSGRVYFQDEVSLAAALASIYRRPDMDTPVLGLPGYDKAAIATVLNGQKAVLDPDTLDRLLTAAGVMLQSMVKGTEMILGVTREEGFGHLIMFGLGGIYTEVLKDVCFALAPLTLSESLKMVQQIKSFPILKGVRGQEAVSIDKIADNLLRLGLLVSDFPQIKEMDINPLKGVGEILYAVDARVIMDH